MKIIKVPRINALGLKGPEKAPDVIVEGLKDKDLDIGEIEVDNSNIEVSHNQIYESVRKIFDEENEKKEKVVFIGGDHSISAPIFPEEGTPSIISEDQISSPKTNSITGSP